MVSKALGKSIFQRSYYEHIVRSDRDLQQIREYTQNNPAEWELDPLFRK